jgi:uncharacterized membrane protein
MKLQIRLNVISVFVWDFYFMDDLAIARAIHVISVIAWIGGVYLVTFVVLPSVRVMDEALDQIRSFDEIESRFGGHAKIMTLIAGGSGFYMLYKMDAWSRYTSLDYWWIHAMTAIWVLFTVVLFVLEPLFLHAWFDKRAQEAPVETFAMVARFHQILLVASLITVFGAVLGVHG